MSTGTETGTSGKQEPPELGWPVPDHENETS